MSVFDTLRWPITDIYNSQELCAVPHEIKESWARECLRFVRYDPVPARFPRSTDWPEFIRETIDWYSISMCPIQSDTMNRFIKGYFTAKLREQIASH
jgi:hypothetical protein